MKKLLFIVVIYSCCISLTNAQHTAGTSGLLNTPSADFNPDGTISIGGNYLPESITPDKFTYPTANYFIGITYFSFLELAYRMTLFQIPESDNRYTNQDRSMHIRARILKESRYIPAVVIGSNDFLTSDFVSIVGENEKHGNQYFGTLYAVATKNVSLSDNNLGFTLGYAVPTKRTRYYSGPLAGIRFTPSFYKPLSIIAEYDATHINIGASVLLFKHLYLQVFTTEFKDVSAGISFQMQLKTNTKHY